jgi:hypothetical protein
MFPATLHVIRVASEQDAGERTPSLRERLRAGVRVPGAVAARAA